MNNTQITLTTSRLILRIPTQGDSFELQAFEERNMSHLSPWRSTSVEFNLDHTTQIMKWKEEFKENRAIRFLLFLRERPEGEIVGLCNFSQIFRGPLFKPAILGYQIDAVYERKGLMSEAVERGIQYMFEEQNIHRIMANYMPSNARSAQLLQKLGFTIEGRAKKYLLINGQWEDHILTSLTNQRWVFI
ncbi:MAG TPA: GNAT family N-acetyltransferase [Candidatus Rhabdochlamydia sp.]|jgi:ribosomal-protein-alanine N-acetyltransferase|nr:GNAT family N-acetyltransferase [Candidatus Rhabdochlamydia sp.]